MVNIYSCHDTMDGISPLFKSIKKNTSVPVKCKTIENIPDVNIDMHKGGFVKSQYMYYRFFIPKICNADTAIYFDSDCIVLGDVAELAEIELGNNLIAAVRDRYAVDIAFTQFHQGFLPDGICDKKSPSYYSGQLIINCKLWREENITEKLIAFCSKYKTLDMIALNVVCAGRIYELPRQWCVSANYDDANNDTRLLHWHGKAKPWAVTCRNQKYYEEYANEYN